MQNVRAVGVLSPPAYPARSAARDHLQVVTPGVQDRARQRQMLVWALLALDTLALLLAVSTAGLLRLRIDEVLPVATLGWTERHIAASILALPLMILLFWFQGRYNVDESLVGTRDYAHVAHAVTYGVIIVLALSYFSGGEPLVSRSWLLLVWASSIVYVSLARFIARRVVRRLRSHGLLHTRVVIVGASTFSVALAEQFSASKGEGIDVAGFLDEYLPLGQTLLPGITVIGRPTDLLNLTRTDAVDEYIFVPQALPHERLEDIMRLIGSRRGPALRMAVSSRDLLTHGVAVTERSHVPLVTLQRARIRGFDLVLKRALDITGALLGLAVVGPIALVALTRSFLLARRPLLVPEVIHSPGGGKVTLWLLSPSVSVRLPIRGVPALLTVLAGRLSLVGPRPIVWRANSRPPRGLWATALPAGLTGPWRLTGPDASMDDQALQDLAYVRNYSIWEDFRILAQSARPGALLGRWDTQFARCAPPDGSMQTHE